MALNLGTGNGSYRYGKPVFDRAGWHGAGTSSQLYGKNELSYSILYTGPAQIMPFLLQKSFITKS